GDELPERQPHHRGEHAADAPDVDDRRHQQPEHAQPRLPVAHHDVEPARQGPELRVAEARRQVAPEGTHAASAPSRSARRSATSSIPTLRRTRLSVIPSSARRSGGTLAWVITAGWFTRLSTPPRDSASVNSSVRSQKRF